jgi:glycosyltransferase involved in cell wall biosynthesis
MRILFVGPIVESEDVKMSPAVSPASNKWQLDLIKGLMENGEELSVLTYLPEPAWPKGKFFVEITPFRNPICLTEYTRYINFPGLRFKILGKKFKRALSLMMQDGNFKPEILLTYNATEANLALGHFFQNHYKGKWISIIADGYSMGSPDSEIFLSYGYFMKSDKEPKLHLDGAPPVFQGKNASQPTNKIILYSGSLDIWTGIEHFVKQFLELRPYGYELHIYGKGVNREIERLATENENIKVMGFVSSEELSNACEKAYAFVNPRPTHLPGVENNFPSKILFYISFGKPILSTKTKGISASYDEILNYYDPLDINSLRNQFNQLSRLSYNDLLKIFEKNKEFCKLNTWEMQARKIVALCHSLNP